MIYKHQKYHVFKNFIKHVIKKLQIFLLKISKPVSYFNATSKFSIKTSEVKITSESSSCTIFAGRKKSSACARLDQHAHLFSSVCPHKDALKVPRLTRVFFSSMAIFERSLLISLKYKHWLTFHTDAYWFTNKAILFKKKSVQRGR